MKGILVVLDGLGDLPCRQLNDKTPLEAADVPNLDFLAARGEMGLMHPVKPDFIPESDEAVVSIFGNSQINSTRGQLEAKGAGLKLVRGDLAFRVNFATVDSMEEGNIIDRRAGRTLTTEEAQELGKALNKINMSVKFTFVPTVQHRAALVFHGGFSDNISGNDSTYNQGKSIPATKVGYCKPLDDDENSQYSANIANEFVEKAFEALDRHPVNQERRRKGLLPANYLMIRGAGIEIPKLKIYRKWASVSYMPLEIGFSKLSGMQVYSFEYPKLKGLDAYQNLYDGLKKACDFSIKTIEKLRKDSSVDYIYVHIKETDLPGHDNKPIEKKLMIEYIDQTLFKFLRKFAPSNDVNVAVTGDHSTPCKLKSHSADPVPVLLYNNSELREKHFSETEAAKGKLGVMNGDVFLKKMGFDR
ncbi:MAG: alkaline phosphatase family protein [Candidatus Pacearchaeota archaeon]